MTFAEQILSEIKAIDKKIERCISQLKTLDSQITKLDPNFEFENELSQESTQKLNLDQHEKFIIENSEKFAETVYLRNKGASVEEVANMLGFSSKQSVYSLFWAAKVRGYITNPAIGRYVVTDLFRELHPEKTTTLKSVN